MKIGKESYGITVKEGQKMATKKVNFNQKGIEKLPNDKPVLYSNVK